MSEAPGVNINLGEVMRGASDARLLVARSIAIQSYANLEQSLCLLFAHLSDTNHQVAGTIFFRLTNSNSRLAILDKLMRMKHGGDHRLFFNSLIAMLKPMDGRRNEIVHWHQSANILVSDDGALVTDLVLTPPNFWIADENTPEITVEVLEDFDVKCDFVGRLITVFTMTELAKASPMQPAWLGIFEQPLAYPPPDGHPGLRQPKAPPVPPQSSEW